MSQYFANIYDDDFDTSSELGKDLKRIYEFKKVSKDLCNNKTPLRKHSIDFKEINTFEGDLEDVFIKVVNNNDTVV